MASNVLLHLERDSAASQRLKTLQEQGDAINRLNRVLLQEVGGFVAKLEGRSRRLESIWQMCVLAVARAETLEIHEMRDQFAELIREQLDMLKSTYNLARSLPSVPGEEAVDADVLLPDVARLERLIADVIEPWKSAEDLEDLAARDYPLTTEDLDRIGPSLKPAASWYAEESKPF